MSLVESKVTPLIGFAPDLDPETPGIMLSCDAIYPTTKGFRPTQAPQALIPAPAIPLSGINYNQVGSFITTYSSGSSSTYNNLFGNITTTQPVIGAYRARYLDLSEDLFIGTPTALWRDVNNAWTDVSGGQIFTAAQGSQRWEFAQFGNDVLATDDIDEIQIRPETSANFVVLGGSPPKGKILVSVDNFVFILNTNTLANQWWCSGIGTDQVWTPDIATQAANGVLVETYGDITAGRKLGQDLVIYKLRSMYLAQYVGPPVIWAFQLLSSETGTWGQESVVEMADAHVFPGFDDFYTFNGGKPTPLKSPLREFFFQDSLDQNYADQMIGRWDKQHGVVVWHYPSVNALPLGTLDTWIAWHPETNHWTMGSRVIEYAMQSDVPVSTGAIYDNAGIYITTYDSGSTRTYNALFPGFVPVGPQAVFLTDHILYTLDGQPEASTFTTGDTGDDERFSYVVRVKPKFGTYPTSGTLTELYKTNLGDSLTTGQTVNLASQGWFNFRRSARFHRYTMSFPLGTDYTIIGYEPITTDSGSR